MVLGSQPLPTWLKENAPDVDVVLSSRTRVMRNLTGHCFPNRASSDELISVMEKLLAAAKSAEPSLIVYKGLSTAEREHLVSCRLISPEFEWTLPGRALLLSPDRSTSLMINEEDHLRIQAVTAGSSLGESDALAIRCLDSFSARLPFAFSPDFGFLSASPYNSGSGRRRSSMFHLIGLAHSKRLPSVLSALNERGLVVRGLFGESSRAIGAFVQVSAVEMGPSDFAGACEYVIREERSVRRSFTRAVILERAVNARDFAVSSRSLTLADALRVLAWVRWASFEGLEGFPSATRAADVLLTSLDIKGTTTFDHTARRRAELLRESLCV